MAELYTNLNTVTLYKTPKFNIIDTVLFSSATSRDNYFDSIPSTDKLEITEFTDLYEGRQFVLPYNYIDLKDYNTMKLYYNDGLGHTETYYCNVDNYLYMSTDACFPVYRIDYFLTFGYMLYGKNIDMVTDRRTVGENSLTKNMKADAVAVPRLKYTKHDTYYLLPGDNPKTPYYVVYLNKTTGGVGKQGINCKMQLYIGEDASHNRIIYDIDTYTIGCYVAIADKDHLNNIIGTEPMEYIEKIIEIDTPVLYLTSPDSTSLNSNGYVYLTQDITLTDFGSNDAHYFCKVSLFDETKQNLVDTAGFSRAERVNIYPNHKKRILEWQPTKGIVIQGNEFDIKDFNDNDFPSLPSVVSKYEYLYSTIYFFNFLGYTFAYPLGYKHEAVNMDYMVKWQSGRNFSYSSDYTNSLAYKELQEYNTQAVKYAKQQAGVQSYYNNQLLANTKTQLDISKQQSLISYQGQINEINNNVANLRSQYFSGYRALNYSMTGIGGTVAAVLGFRSEIPAVTGAIEQDVAANNMDLLNQQRETLWRQHASNIRSLDAQLEQARINTQYQNDCLAIARDNTIANIAISNKYNNAKPNAYYETDFTQYSSYYYIFYIDNSDGDVIEQNIKNRYNVLGTYVGYVETWKPSFTEGLYFDYVKGSVINNSNDVSSGIPNEIYIELISRIEQGVRLWHLDQLDWFGNLLIDNTNLGTAEPYNTYTEQQKQDLLTSFNNMAYNWLDDKATIRNSLLGLFPDISSSYITWFVNNQPWGETLIPVSRQNKMTEYWMMLRFNYTVAETKTIIKNADFLTIYEKQWVLPDIV